MQANSSYLGGGGKQILIHFYQTFHRGSNPIQMEEYGLSCQTEISQAKATMFKTGGGPKPKDAEIDDLSLENVDTTGRTFTIPNPYGCGEGDNSGWDNLIDERGSESEIARNEGARSDALALAPAGDSPSILPVVHGPTSTSVSGRANSSQWNYCTQETAPEEEFQKFVRTAKACRVEEYESKRELYILSILEKEASLQSLQ
ncbi:uncharacterized protein LOC131891261 [Tigriopus californicus]|uniref:uncharacterized protein LOC131891261 n=1 Tax=Tigriopus californicus TaxID=6832 RepID=UPI0027DAB28D|nr:uncharacterized protein LOC131891261 [Tigriopus californicus]